MEEINKQIQSVTNETELYDSIKNIILDARKSVYHAANTAMVQSYWLIGRNIVVYEQNGHIRAEYGKEVLKNLSKKLTVEFGKGYTVSNLKNIRQFYLAYQKGYALRSELSWTHYRILMRVQNENAREYYTEECANANWSTRQLERQIHSLYYERLLSSRDKDRLQTEENSKAQKAKPEDFIKDPYILEFIDVKQSPIVYEKDLETALIGYLENFLLELGRGFAFVAQQKHICSKIQHYSADG